MTSHLVAYSAFILLMKINAKLDVFGIIRQIEDDFIFPKEKLILLIEENKNILIEMADDKKLIIDNIIRYQNAEEILEEGIKHLGIFHTKKPLKFNKKKDVISQSLKMLFYYHNKMASYF
jgi:glycerol-3-phosphate O-acyltransferase